MNYFYWESSSSQLPLSLWRKCQVSIRLFVFKSQQNKKIENLSSWGISNAEETYTSNAHKKCIRLSRKPIEILH